MSTRNEIRRKCLDIMQRCDMRRIVYMHGYVYPGACTNFRPLGFSLLAGWKCGMVFLFVSVDNSMTSFERSRKEEEKNPTRNRFEPVLYPDPSRKARHNRQY